MRRYHRRSMQRRAAEPCDISLAKVAAVAVLAVVALGVIANLKDIARYARISSM